jgi:hypothetical protein
MTEAEWLACTDPQPMLEFLQDKASDRKLRLFAYACCRHLNHLPADDRTKRAVEAAEQLADGLITEGQRDTFLRAAMEAAVRRRGLKLDRRQASDQAAAWALHDKAVMAAFAVFQQAQRAAMRGSEERLAQCNLIRDLFGKPFRTVRVDSAWLTWNDATIHKLAAGIYDERAFDRLPILADALEDADCTNAEILTHCRQPGEHVRGCWVVDLLLGRH